MELIEGKEYTFRRLRSRNDGNNAPQIVKKRMRLIRKYPHHAQFEDEFGIRISYRYFDIQKMLDGELIL
ncbi:MAG: hypothetical protein ACI4F1_08865 [Bariatricus sp.]